MLCPVRVRFGFETTPARRSPLHARMEPEVSLPAASASRSAVRSFRKAVEDALHRLGWILVDVSSLDGADAPGAAMALLQGVFVEACRTFALPESDLAELMQEHNEYTGCQALSYLPLGSEPLYSEGQVQQVCALRAPTENSCVYAHSPLLHLSKHRCARSTLSCRSPRPSAMRYCRRRPTRRAGRSRTATTGTATVGHGKS